MNGAVRVCWKLHIYSEITSIEQFQVLSFITI